jgi:GntR family transcriptional repressor for pyruvate dehydrogenase complex
VKLSAPDRIADTLRTAALAAGDGAWLGSEETLCARFEVTAPTLRQAARLLEHEEVLKVRRGVRGGYYAHRPKIDTIARVAATWLRGNADVLDESRLLMDALTPLLAELAMRSPRLDELAEFAQASPPDASLESFADRESRFVTLLVALADNEPLRLVFAIFFQVGLTVPRRRRVSDRILMEEVEAERIALARALIAGDAATAVGHALTHRRLILAAMKRNLLAEKAA